jgi:hypothetical protein
VSDDIVFTKAAFNSFVASRATKEKGTAVAASEKSAKAKTDEEAAK